MSTKPSRARLIIALYTFLWLMLILMLVACGGDSDQVPATPGEAAVQESPTTEPTSPAAETAVEATPEPTDEVQAVEPSATAEPSGATPTAEAATSIPEPTPTPGPVEAQVTEISLAQVASGFSRPLYLTHAFDQRLFVVEQDGRIKVIDGGQVVAEPFLDIGDRVGASALEQGLLSVAFHPDYQANGRFYVNYTDIQGDTVVAEYQVDAANPNQADRDSERVLLTVNQPYGNHNGGQLKFGPDGYLYIGMGDGGSAGDPMDQGQNPGTLLGALLRLDVDNADPDGQSPYGIPADNPFNGADGGLAEVWAYGLRNPWRFSFDKDSGDLYLSDVGQNIWEEVNFQAAGAGGGSNYGWNVMEASACYGAETCDASGFVMPVAEYSHQGGHCSVTGGYIYRGSSFPALTGNYFFADYCSGTIWSLFNDEDDGWQQAELQRTGMIISSFGEDLQGELYIIDHAQGNIYQLQS